MKPFKPPTLLRPPDSQRPKPCENVEPPAKRRRINDETDGDSAPAFTDAARRPAPSKPSQASTTRIPLDTIRNPNSSALSQSSPSRGKDEYYTVLWRKMTNKKNKTWDGDGMLHLANGLAILQDPTGKNMGKRACDYRLSIGSELSIAGKEVEIESVLSREDFLAAHARSNKAKHPAHGLKQTSGPQSPAVPPPSKPQNIVYAQRNRMALDMSSLKTPSSAFKAPLLNNTVQDPQKDSKVPVPRHDPKRENALLMKRPRHAPKGKQIVDVVVDPLLSDKLREHQRVGVSFLYECVMGMKGYDGEGAILADEMGLGKTLQTIALLWTLLKQNPVYEDPPVIKKALIVCPVTLINNWRKEFRRWLGSERIGVLVVKDGKTRVTDFTRGKAYSVMIIGYEKLRMVQEDLQKASGIDIVIADEGHRLKTAQNKSALVIKSINTERRIILSGTPLQNDLAEFHTMVDFVNPGLLKKYTAFKRDFETPIVRSRQPEASDHDKEKGAACSAELAEITGKFILRRTAEILSKYLPPKTEYVLFCRPTKAQASVYRTITRSAAYTAALGSSALALELINVLKKVCNSPNLLSKKDDRGEDITKPEIKECIPQSLLKTPCASGKLQVLDSLLHQIRTTTDEKVVLISNYTTTLDILGNLLTSLSYKYLRLDGTTPQNKRQDLVDQFNRTPARDVFVFLLSAKAGGLGLNLHGASRLVLFDLDWNPATDMQAMARVHRDGQKRPCYIYRLLTQGALDEKIFQRQVTKTGLADSIVDGKSGVSGFTREELRDLFTLDENENCQTHTLLGCTCGGKGMPLVEADEDVQSSRNDLASLSGGVDSAVRDADGVEVVHLEDDVSFSPYSSSSGWTSAKIHASQEAEQSRKSAVDKAARAKMLSLMQYAHFDTSFVNTQFAPDSAEDGDGAGGSDEDETLAPDPLEGVVEDSVLRSVLREGGRRIGFVLSKLSG